MWGGGGIFVVRRQAINLNGMITSLNDETAKKKKKNKQFSTNRILRLSMLDRDREGDREKGESEGRGRGDVQGDTLSECREEKFRE